MTDNSDIRNEDNLSDKEIEQRRDKILKRMHKLPPKSNKDYVGDPKPKGKNEARKRQSKRSES